MSDYSTSFSTVSSSSHGYSGLASGIDSESIVEKMLLGTKQKIQKQESGKQQLLWKQTQLRSDITSLKAFQLKYMSFTHPETNLMSSKFYQRMSAVSSSDTVSAIATSSAPKGDMTINNVTKLAKSTTKKSAPNVTDVLKGTIDASALANLTEKSTVIFDLDGIKKEITLSAKAVDGYAKNTAEALKKNLEKSLSSVYGSGIEIEINGDQLSIGTTVKQGRQITVSSSKDGGTATLGILGFKDGMSNKLNLGVAIGDLNFKKPLVGSQFVFQINGVEIKANSQETLGTVINRINQSDADVNVSYSALTDSFTVERKQTGKNLNITFEQSSGNLLDSLFSAGQATSITGMPQKDDIMKGTGPVDKTLLSCSGGSFDYTYNGVESSVAIAPKTDGTKYTSEELVTKFNELLKAKHGVGLDGKANVQILRADDGSSYSIESNVGVNISFSDTDSQSITKAMGFEAGQTQAFSKDTKLSELGISQGTIKFSNDPNKRNINLSYFADKSIEDFTAAIKDKLTGIRITGDDVKVLVDESTGAVSISGIEYAKGCCLEITGEDTDGSAALNTLFGTDNISMGSGTCNYTKTNGENAVLNVNGVDVERNSNSFTIDGIDITLKETTDTPVTINVTQDTDTVYKGIESFVEEYNKLVETLNGQVNATASYRKYPPLTKEQEKEMSENEIEEWNKKAKEGLLRNDSTISSILSRMRSVLYTKPEGCKFALYEIGITTSSNYKDNGKLVISDSAALKSALESDCDSIRQLFSDSKEGIVRQINSVIDEATKTGYKTINSLVYKAGNLISASDDTSTIIGKQISDKKSKIASLKRTYEAEYDRYWKQFTSMEKMIQRMNSQSSWLTQQMG